MDCPISKDSNITGYWTIEWEAEGNMGGYAMPPPIYVKVLESLYLFLSFFRKKTGCLTDTQELLSRMHWCTADIDCDDPQDGVTC